MATDLTLNGPFEPEPVPSREVAANGCFRLDHALEARWIHAAANGDHDAFARLMGAHQERIYSLCLRLLASPEDAAEATQDVFVRAFHALPKYRPESLFSTWLYQIALNRCRDFWKRASSRLKALTISLSGKECTLNEPCPSPDHRAHWQDSLKQLDHALQTLPTRDREILILSCVENLSHRECADILGLSPRAVEGRLYRAREKLRKICDTSLFVKTR